MSNSAPNLMSSLFAIPNYRVARVGEAEAVALQPLYEECADFWRLTYGEGPLPTDAVDEFRDLPPGSGLADNHTFGVFDSAGHPVALLASLRNYPDSETWSIGLLMVSPRARRRGLGSQLFTAFAQWVAEQGARRLQLVVLVKNSDGLQFWQNHGFTQRRSIPQKEYGEQHHDVAVMDRRLG